MWYAVGGDIIMLQESCKDVAQVEGGVIVQRTSVFLLASWSPLSQLELLQLLLVPIRSLRAILPRWLMIITISNH